MMKSIFTTLLAAILSASASAQVYGIMQGFGTISQVYGCTGGGDICFVKFNVWYGGLKPYGQDSYEYADIEAASAFWVDCARYQVVQTEPDSGFYTLKVQRLDTNAPALSTLVGRQFWIVQEDAHNTGLPVAPPPINDGSGFPPNVASCMQAHYALRGAVFYQNGIKLNKSGGNSINLGNAPTDTTVSIYENRRLVMLDTVTSNKSVIELNKEGAVSISSGVANIGYGLFNGTEVTDYDVARIEFLPANREIKLSSNVGADANSLLIQKTKTVAEARIDYASNISGTFTSRSLVDKGYVDARGWGSQTVATTATLEGNGTSGSPLGIATTGAAANDYLYFDGTSWMPHRLAVGTAQIDDNAITTAKIAAGAVGTTDVADDAITTAKIAAGAVGTTDVANDAITTAKIAAGAVGTTDVADDAITAAKIAADAVGSSELASTAVTAGSYTSANITVDADGRITAASNGSGGGGTPGGTSAELQYNNSGAFDGQANITTTENATTGTELSIVGGSVTTGNALNVTANALTTGSVVNISSTSTAAGGNTQTGLNVSLSGANGTSTQTTYGAQIANTHTGTSSTNVGLNVTASGGANNYAAIFTGSVGIGTTTPQYPFHISNSGLTRFGVQYGSASYGGIEFRTSNNEYWGFYVGGPTYNSGYANVFGIWQWRNAAGTAVNKYRLFIANSGNVGIGIEGESAVTSKLMVDGDNGYTQFRLADSYTPTGSSDTNGATGQVAWDADYIYIKTAAGWKRSALATF